MREIDTEHNWFFNQGYEDGRDGLRLIMPDEARHPFQRSDYCAGYRAGLEDNFAEMDRLEKINEQSR